MFEKTKINEKEAVVGEFFQKKPRIDNFGLTGGTPDGPTRDVKRFQLFHSHSSVNPSVPTILRSFYLLLQGRRQEYVPLLESPI